MVMRKTPLTMSAAPAAASQKTASHRFPVNPKKIIATPHNPAAIVMASPWR